MRYHCEKCKTNGFIFNRKTYWNGTENESICPKCGYNKFKQIKMNRQLKQVREFNRLAGVRLHGKPSPTEFKLQMKLIKEELKELEEAFEGNNDVEVLDALADTLYTIYGMIVRFDADYVIKEAFDRVHESNMSKFCVSYEEALKTIDKYKEQGINARMRNIKGKLVVYREEDRKVLKSVNYKKVYLKDLAK